jgi:hypothetical protein
LVFGDGGAKVTGVPREFVDGMAEFAAGLRRWPEWRSWFAVRASRLVRVVDRTLFEQLKRDPEEAVATLFRQEKVTLCPAEPRPVGRLDDPISPEEYEVYTAVCRQLDLFLFNRPDTIFEDQTDRDTVGHSVNRPRLEFDETRREYRVVEPELAERFLEPSRQWFVRHPEMPGQYRSRNDRRWSLEKRFQVENGYRFMSELGEHEQDLAQGAFCLSRVGFSADGQFALVFIRYAVTCSYYLVFERSPTRWERADFCVAWVT